MSKLAELHEKIKGCLDCDLSQSRTRAVPGDGSEGAEILFIGEAPGWNEDQQGRPFVGPAGQFLEELLVSVGLKREDVFITNVVKCRPPNNRDPLTWEIEACRKYLEQQITLIQPRMIVTLGRYSMARYFPGQSISKVHGTHTIHNGIICFAMYHPAAALHQQSLRKTIESDMQKLPALLTQKEKMTGTELRAQQLSMF